MSFGDLLSDLALSGGVPAAGAGYTRGVLITEGVRAGESQNSIIAGMQQLGIGIRAEQARSLIRDEQTRQAAAATANQLDLNTPISELLGAAPPAGFTGQYVHQVAVTYRTRDEEGNYMLGTRTMGIKSASILTAGEAASAALDIIAQSPAEEGGSFDVGPADILSAGLSGAWYDVQGRSLPSI